MAHLQRSAWLIFEPRESNRARVCAAARTKRRKMAIHADGPAFTMFAIHSCPLPPGSLLSAYQAHGAYADCYATDVAGVVTHEAYVAAFYTSPVFKVERTILKWVVAKPATDAQARRLAAATLDQFAAWRVEKRAPNELLLTDYLGRTRSWLMVAPMQMAGGAATRLYFGSAVVPPASGKPGREAMGPLFRALLGFHKLYSVVLLRAARSRVIKSLAV